MNTNGTTKTIQAPTAVAAHCWALIQAGATDDQMTAEIARVLAGALGTMPAHKIERAARVAVGLARRSYAEAVA